MTQKDNNSKTPATSPKPSSNTSPKPKEEPKPEITKFQWSIFPDSSKREQFVIRCDDLADLLGYREVIFQLMETEAQTRPVQQPTPESDPAHCAIHDLPMKQRKSSNGKIWYDHRWQDEEDDWHICNGKTERVQQPN